MYLRSKVQLCHEKADDEEIEERHARQMHQMPSEQKIGVVDSAAGVNDRHKRHHNIHQSVCEPPEKTENKVIKESFTSFLLVLWRSGAAKMVHQAGRVRHVGAVSRATRARLAVVDHREELGVVGGGRLLDVHAGGRENGTLAVGGQREWEW